MLFRKIYKNKWMVLCLLLGLVLAISIICAIPMFSRGMFKDIIAKDLKNAETTKDINPGAYISSLTLDSTKADTKKIYDEFEMQTAINMADLGLKVRYEKATLLSLIYLMDKNSADVYCGANIRFGGISNIESHITMVQGSMFSKSVSGDGCYDVIVSEDTQRALDLKIGDIYYVKANKYKKKDITKLKIAGIYKKKDVQDSFWDNESINNDLLFLTDYQLFRKKLLNTGIILPDQVSFYEYFDYNQLVNKNLENVVKMISDQSERIKVYNGSIYFSANDILKADIDKENQLNSMLMVMEVPIIILIIIYTFMISDLIAEQEKNEVAVLKSRGAGTIGICLTYLLEALLISGAALLVGPLLGALICKILGVCNGFLEFVNRSAISVELTASEYRNSFIAAAVFILTLMLPIMLATRTTIVQYKQSKSKKRQPIWKRYFLDVLLLGIAGYGYYTYKSRQNYISISGVSSNQVPVDPIVYLIIGLFIIGTALVFLRIYPYIIKLIFFLIKNRCSEEVYISLIDVGRSRGKEQFLMVFLIFTLSIGIFDMRAANVVNRGIECNQRYILGADMTLKAQWNYTEEDKKTNKATSKDQEAALLHSYVEPLYSDYQHLNGAERVTKVFANNYGNIKMAGNPVTGVHIMGIIPYEFAQTAYFQQNLLPTHWYNYCNVLTKYKNGILISSAMADNYHFALGDKIIYFWSGSPEFEGTICGIVDYWPSYNSKQNSNLVVANLSTLQAHMPVQPYEVWVKKKSPDSTNDIYNSLIAKKLYLTSAEDADQLILGAKSEPMVQGTNGALTLGFIATMVITAIGFILYWVLSIKGKFLQFGVLRAMGVSFKKIISMILYEQIMISGVAIAIGVILGQVSARLFMPLMNLASNSDLYPISSDMILSTASYTKLVVIIFFMLAIGVMSLVLYISKMKMDQVIKLGED